MPIKNKPKPTASIKKKSKKTSHKKIKEPEYTYSYENKQKFDANGNCLHVSVQQYTECCMHCGHNIWG